MSSFQLRSVSRAEDSLALLDTLIRHPDVKFGTWSDLCVATSNGRRDPHRTQIIQLAELTKRDRGGIKLTSLGRSIANAPAYIQTELLHFLLYTGWDEHRPSERLPLWTYRQLCDILWEQDSTSLDRRRLLDDIYDRAEQLHSLANIPTPVITKESVSAAARWLEQLTPPAIKGGQFARRNACRRELLMLAVGYIYRDTIGQPNDKGQLNSADLPLNERRKEQLARLCLLNPAALERLISYCLSVYPGIIVEGTATGITRFLRLHYLPSIAPDDGNRSVLI